VWRHGSEQPSHDARQQETVLLTVVNSKRSTLLVVFGIFFSQTYLSTYCGAVSAATNKRVLLLQSQKSGMAKLVFAFLANKFISELMKPNKLVLPWLVRNSFRTSVVDLLLHYVKRAQRFSKIRS